MPPGEGRVEGGGVREAAVSRRNRLRVADVMGGISVATEDGEQVSWVAGRGEAGAVVGRGRGGRGRGGRGRGGRGRGRSEEFLPPGLVVGATGLRCGGVNAEGLKEETQPALVLVCPLASEPEEEEEEVGEEGNGPEQDGEPEVGVVA